MNENDILEIIRSDKRMMHILIAAKDLDLPDWWIGAGFVRNKVWDYLSKYQERTHNADIDIDLIYFDRNNIAESQEKIYEQTLVAKIPNEHWSVKNQARMHLKNGDNPYLSSEDELTKWPETATAVAVKIDATGDLELLAPYGTEDLVNMIIRKSPGFERDEKIFIGRIEKKNWTAKWPQVKIIY